MPHASAIELDGSGLTIEQLASVARDPSVTIVCSPPAIQRVEAAAELVRGVVDRYVKSIQNKESNPIMDYGITTGFGEFKRIPIDPGRLGELQVNILLSHAAGVGETLDEDDMSNYYPSDVVRAVIVLRINAFLQGHSGISLQVLKALVELVNRRMIPLVPLRGSVGSSGDLAPLAHLFVWLCEKGRSASRFYQLNLDSQAGPVLKSTALPEMLGIELLEPTAKEGLALTNGATFSAAMLALAVHDATSLATAADIAAAMSAEALLGCARAFDKKVHEARQQKGQILSAACIRNLLEHSTLLETAAEVQDPYSIRCAPAVHGASRDALEFARSVVSCEINAATDNPLFFLNESSWDLSFRDNWRRRRENRREPTLPSVTGSEYDGSKRHSYSAGNFHGQPIALAADFLAIALAEFANISERRTQLLMDRDHNRGLPANLIPDAGLNSGFMIAQYCAAGLVSENKVLAHPASVDSIPTSSNSEDHNSMATIAARKLRTVLANVRHTLAIELLVATQAAEWATLFDELSSGILPDYGELRKNYTDYLRLDDPPKEGEQQKSAEEKRDARWAGGGAEREIFEAWTQRSNRERIGARLGIGTRKAYRRIRESVGPMIVDRVLSEDIRLVAMLLAPRADPRAALVDAVMAREDDET